MTTKGKPRKLAKMAPFTPEEQEMIDAAPNEKAALDQVWMHRQFMTLPLKRRLELGYLTGITAEQRIEAGYLTDQERRLVAAHRLFDEWYAGLSIAQRRQLWALPRTEQLATIEQANVYPQIQALIEGH